MDGAFRQSIAKAAHKPVLVHFTNTILGAIMDRDPQQARLHLEFAFPAFHEFKNQAKLSHHSELYSSLFNEE